MKITTNKLVKRLMMPKLLKSFAQVEKLLTEDQFIELFNNPVPVEGITIDDKTYIIMDGKFTKIVVGEDYKYIFNKVNGNFKRWGKTYEDDPSYSPIGAEILDIEITTICNGIKGKLCPMCYKSNTPNGKNMSFDTFKKIMDKQGNNLTQIAFGVDSMATSNPDLWKMAAYCRTLGIVPNITVADVSDEVADKLMNVMGAVAISRYAEKNVCYDSIKKLTDRGMSQINMHFCIMEETNDACLETLNDIKTDPRLAKMNAIVLLSLKKRGRGVKFTTLSKEKYANLVKVGFEKGITLGFDSCGALKFLDSIKDHPRYEDFKVMTEPCESTNFSEFIDVNGDFYPCSFAAESDGWHTGIPIVESTDMLTDVWYNDRVVAFRNNLNSNCNNCHKARECPIYKV